MVDPARWILRCSLSEPSLFHLLSSLQPYFGKTLIARNAPNLWKLPLKILFSAYISLTPYFAWIPKYCTASPLVKDLINQTNSATSVALSLERLCNFLAKVAMAQNIFTAFNRSPLFSYVPKKNYQLLSKKERKTERSQKSCPRGT